MKHSATPQAATLSAGLSIGQLAQHAGVGVETIRYYQKRGLLPTIAAQGGAIRRYAPELVQRIGFVKRAQKLGFTLEEIATLLQLNDAVERSAIRHLANERLTHIQQKIADLQKMEHALQHLIHACSDEVRHQHCPIIASLSGTDQN